MRRARLILLHAALVGCSPAASEPFVVVPSTAPPELAYASDTAGWASRLVDSKVMGFHRVISVTETPQAAEFNPEWTTDEWIFGCLGTRPAVVQMSGQRGLASWAERHFPLEGIAYVAAKGERPWPQRRFDQGGNLIVSPPLPSRFPHGRIVVGRDMDVRLKEFFKFQRVQTGPKGDLVEVDTSWLRVGHVDEVVAFLPGAGGRSFHLVLPDPEKGFELLSKAPSERVLFAAPGAAETFGNVLAAGPRWLEAEFGKSDGTSWEYVRIISGKGAGQVARVQVREGKRLIVRAVWKLGGPSATQTLNECRAGRCEQMPIWFEVPDSGSRFVAVTGSQLWRDGAGDTFPALVTAGELADDASLRASASSCAKRIFGEGGVAAILTRELEIARENVVRLPVLLVADSRGRDVFSLVPNPINLVNLDREVVLLRPFGPRLRAGVDETDVFLGAWREMVEGLGLRTRFVDGWDALHRYGGGAHCGTNVRRRWPSPE